MFLLRCAMTAKRAQGTTDLGMLDKYSFRDHVLELGRIDKGGKRIVDFFRDVDADRSGEVDKKEFRRAIREIGFEAPRGALDELFDDLDADRGGTIEYKELHSALRQGAAMKLKPVLKPGGAGAIETKASNRLRVADCGRSAVKRM